MKSAGFGGEGQYAVSRADNYGSMKPHANLLTNAFHLSFEFELPGTRR